MSTSTAQLRSAIPRVPSDVIRRPRLVSLLDYDAPLTLVRGGCGTGKTVAIAEWAHTTPSSVMWVTVEKEAATSTALARSLLRLLTREGLTVRSDEADSRPWAAVADALQSAAKPVVLVIDDAALLDRDAVFDLCRIIAATARTRVIAAANRRSAFDNDGLELVIDRSMITARELMFDREEIAQAFGIDEAAAAEILISTDGFPAVIHAAAKRGLDADRGTLLDIAADTVEDYMRVRIERSGYDPESLRALVRLSVADVVDLPLARVLSGDARVEELLDEAEGFGFGAWSTTGEKVFTFVPIARVLLRRELHRSYPEDLPRLQRTAVEGALRRRSPMEALRLAVEADDLSLAADVIMLGWHSLLEHEGGRVVTLLGPIPVARLKEQPLVAMLLAICYIASRLRRLRGLQLLRVAIAAANSRRSRLPAVERIFIWTAESSALRLVGMTERAGQVATKALRLLMATPEPTWEAYADEIPLLCTQLGLSLHYGGMRKEAIDCFVYAASLGSAHEIQNAFHSISMLSGIHALNGDVPEARHYVDLIRNGPWTDHLLNGYRGTFYRIAEALLAVEDGDARAARMHVKAFAPHRATSEHWETMAMVEGWVALHQERPAIGLEQLQSFMRLRGKEALGHRSTRALSRTRALLQLASGDTLGARDTLRRDAPDDRFETAIEHARGALFEDRPADALRILNLTTLEPETPRQRAEAAAVRCAAMIRTTGPSGARGPAESLGSQLEDRELSTPLSLLPQRDAHAVHAALSDLGFDIPQASSVFPRPSAQPRLTPRERIVLSALASGASLPSIASDLNVSLNTLKTQLRGVYRKLQATNRTEAVERASNLNLLADR